MLRRLLLRASRSRRLARRLTRSPGIRRGVRRFVPGEELSDALEAAEHLRRDCMASVFTRLGEDVESEREADRVRDHYLRMLDQADERGLPTEISVKPTQLGLRRDPEGTERRLLRLAEEAGHRKRRVWVDMEGTEHTDATLRLFRRARSRHGNLAICLQAYLRRTPEDLEELLPLRPTIRLVKGAYAEPPERAYRRRAEVDAAYLRLGRRLLEAASEATGMEPAFATHDTDLLRELVGEARRKELEPGDYEIQMLYGIRRRDAARLAAEGEAVRVLISYGPEWFAWYMRRLAERPANLWFAARALLAG